MISSCKSLVAQGLVAPNVVPKDLPNAWNAWQDMNYSNISVMKGNVRYSHTM